MVTAKVIEAGDSQSIQLPKEFWVKSDKAYLKRMSDGSLMTEIGSRDLLLDTRHASLRRRTLFHTSDPSENAPPPATNSAVKPVK